MPEFVVGHSMPGAEKLSASEHKVIARKSCLVLQGLGGAVQWVQSFVTDDRLYCIYRASDEEALCQHARRGDFPADRVARGSSRLDPTDAD